MYFCQVWYSKSSSYFMKISHKLAQLLKIPSVQRQAKNQGWKLTECGNKGETNKTKRTLLQEVGVKWQLWRVVKRDFFRSVAICTVLPNTFYYIPCNMKICHVKSFWHLTKLYTKKKLDRSSLADFLFIISWV